MTTSGGINLTKLLLAEGHLELDLVPNVIPVPSFFHKKRIVSVLQIQIFLRITQVRLS